MRRDVESIRQLIITDGYVDVDHDGHRHPDGNIYHWDANAITGKEAKSVLLLLVNALGIQLVRHNGKIEIESIDE